LHGAYVCYLFWRVATVTWYWSRRGVTESRYNIMDLPIPGTFLAAGEMYYMSRRVAAETVMVLPILGIYWYLSRRGALCPGKVHYVQERCS